LLPMMLELFSLVIVKNRHYVLVILQ
jgi:hypothetical protein